MENYLFHKDFQHVIPIIALVVALISLLFNLRFRIWVVQMFSGEQYGHVFIRLVKNKKKLQYYLIFKNNSKILLRNVVISHDGVQSCLGNVSRGQCITFIKLKKELQNEALIKVEIWQSRQLFIQKLYTKKTNGVLNYSTILKLRNKTIFRFHPNNFPINVRIMDDIFSKAY